MELNENQKAAVDCLDHNLQIVACAGSGKTEVITRRIVNILQNKKEVLPKNIVAFTFTEKAAENMRLRVQRSLADESEPIDISQMYIGTIHAFCRKVLISCVPEFSDFRMLDTVTEHLFIMKYFRKCGAERLGLSKREISLFATCIDKMINTYEAYDEWPSQDQEVFRQYKELLYEKKFLNFSFLIHELIVRMNDPGIMAYFDGIKYLIVDEYQDVDDLQEMLISQIAGRGANICVVGDDDQTIYQFRGSNSQNMIDFSKRYKDVVTIHLDTNYRSGKAILDVADSVISNNDNRLPKTMKAGKVDFMGTVRGSCLRGMDEEYEKLVRDIKKLSTTVPYGDMVILVRKRSRLNELTKKLTEENISYHAEENDAFFESDFYRRFRNLFYYLEIPNDENRQTVIEDWKQLVDGRNLKKAIRYLSRCGETNERFVSLLDGFTKELGLEETGEELRFAKGFAEILSDFDRVYVDDSWTVRTSDINIFLDRMAETEYQKTELIRQESDNAVKIMTVHKSKGLEFEAVFLPDLQQGFFPASRVGGKKYYSVLGGIFEERKGFFESDIEDERKLFYVAVTRARKHLYVYSDIEKKEASLFLREMNGSKYCDILIPVKTDQPLQKSRGYLTGVQNGGHGPMKKEPWQIYDMKAIRKAVLDELHGACFGGRFGAAMVEFEDAKKASDDELLKIAERNGIKIGGYRKT